MRAIKVLSLFDGISCARVALDRLGYAVEYYASEIDKYAISIAQKNYPDTIQLGSVTEFDLSLLPTDIDLLIGGSPCQDLSIAKANRKGLDGERSGLFWRYVEIWKAIKPKYFVLENVNSMPKDAKRIITDVMGVEPIMINAALVSAQNRKRLFWTNICADAMGNQTMPQPEDREILLKDVLEIGTARDVYITQRGRGFNKGGDRARDGKAPTLSANSWENNNHIVIRSDPKMTEPVAIDHYNGHRIVPNNKAKTLGTNPQCETAVAWQSIMQNYTIRKLTPVECERLQSLPDNYTNALIKHGKGQKYISKTQRYKCLGNAFNVEVVKHILSFMDIH